MIDSRGLKISIINEPIDKERKVFIYNQDSDLEQLSVAVTEEVEKYKSKGLPSAFHLKRRREMSHSHFKFTVGQWDELNQNPQLVATLFNRDIEDVGLLFSNLGIPSMETLIQGYLFDLFWNSKKILFSEGNPKEWIFKSCEEMLKGKYFQKALKIGVTPDIDYLEEQIQKDTPELYEFILKHGFFDIFRSNPIEEKILLEWTINNNIESF